MLASCMPVDCPFPGVIGESADGQPDGGPSAAVADRERLLDELVGNGADQDPGAEAHQEPDAAVVAALGFLGPRQPQPQTDRTADHERGAGQQPPQRRLADHRR
jgi:hypothetical protein